MEVPFFPSYLPIRIRKKMVTCLQTEQPGNVYVCVCACLGEALLIIQIVCAQANVIQSLPAGAGCVLDLEQTTRQRNQKPVLKTS